MQLALGLGEAAGMSKSPCSEWQRQDSDPGLVELHSPHNLPSAP